MAELNNIQEQLQPAKVLIALSKGRQKLLVGSIEGYESGYKVDGIGIIDGENAILVSLTEQLLPYGGVSEDIPVGDKRRSITSAMSDFDGHQRTAFIIAHYEFTEGAAVASTAFGWLPSGGELALIHAHKNEVNELLEAVGSTLLGDDNYWTSQMFSNEYPWHMSMADGKFAMWRGQYNELAVRPVASLDGYTEATAE